MNDTKNDDTNRNNVLSTITPNLTAGFVIALLNIATALSIAALIFSGPLASHLSAGVGIFLVATLFSGLALPLFSDYKAILSGPRSAQAPVFAAMAASIATALSGQDSKSIAITVMVAILIATLATGIFMYAVGRAKLGNLVRYIPYPVMGGFFAGLGYLLILGGLAVGLGDHREAQWIDYLMNPNALMLLAPTIAMGALVYLLDKKLGHWSVVPLAMLGGGLIFYAILYATGTSVIAAIDNNWLPPPPSTSAVFFPAIVPADLTLVQWPAIAGQAAAIAALIFLSVIMLLLDVSGIEVVLNRDMDPNKELVAAGKTNLIGGIIGSPLTFHSVSDVFVAHKLGGTKYPMVVMYCIVVFAAIAIGPSLITWIPNFTLGSVLIFSGAGLLIKWVWALRKKLPITDFLVILVILAVIINFGILEGIAIGVILAILLFVHQYSQLSIVKSQLKGEEFTSNVDRHPHDQAYLDNQTGICEIFFLQGFLFFGTASRFVDEVKELLKSPEHANLRYLIVDFRAVDALDTSAANSFSKLAQLCTSADLTLIITGCSYKISKQLQSLEDIQSAKENVRFFDDVNTGVGWMDDERLKTANLTNQSDMPDTKSMVEGILNDEQTAAIVLTYGENVILSKGEHLFNQGDPGEALYFIIRGILNINIDLGDGDTLSIRTMRAGAIVGEMALYTGAARSASAIALEDCLLLKVNTDAFQQMSEKHPASASKLHSHIVRLIAERLGRANREIAALSR